MQPHVNQPWTDDHWDKAKTMAAQGKSARYISVALGRSRSSVIGRFNRKKVPLGTALGSSRNAATWTAGELRILRDGFINGLTFDKIGAKIGKSYAAVRVKVRQLRLTRNKPVNGRHKNTSNGVKPELTYKVALDLFTGPGKPLLDLELGECRWPVGNSKTTLFCDKFAPRGRYCDYHAQHSRLRTG